MLDAELNDADAVSDDDAVIVADDVSDSIALADIDGGMLDVELDDADVVSDDDDVSDSVALADVEGIPLDVSLSAALTTRRGLGRGFTRRERQRL